MKYTISERDILKQCSSPFIVSVKSAYQSPSKLILTQEYCPCGDLASLLVKKQKLSE